LEKTRKIERKREKRLDKYRETDTTIEKEGKREGSRQTVDRQAKTQRA
jgi:hypothetical protein